MSKVKKESKMDGQYKAQKLYNERMDDKGFIRVGVRVPEENRNEILAIAKEMRDEYIEKQLKGKS